jgi:hypothetical protein
MWSNARASSSIKPCAKAGDQTGEKHHDVSTPPIPVQLVAGVTAFSAAPRLASADNHSFNTIMYPEIKFGKDGEWTKSGVMQVQYHDITDSANLDTWRGMSYQTVLTPGDQKTGGVIYPYERASG